ncbi:MAG TPA: FMN-binding protein [Methyloradius sp.]
MKWSPYAFMPIAAIIAPSAYANIYLSPEQAQKAIFGDSKLTPVNIQLTDAQRSIMFDKSGVHEPFKTDRIWRTPDGSYFVIDEVIGKHEFIKYAVGINANGTVRQIEVMEYNESYGDEVRNESWRQQFVGKTADSEIKLNKDIKNVSGATLSCKHITDGVKRVITMYDLVLKPLK